MVTSWRLMHGSTERAAAFAIGVSWVWRSLNLAASKIDMDCERE